MNIVIKKMETDAEIKGKAYVHWKSWQEAYSGIVDQRYLDSLTLDKCEKIRMSWISFRCARYLMSARKRDID